MNRQPNRRCSGRRVRECAEAFACAHVHRAELFDPPQLNAIRYAGLELA
jgi:hypothetical protein